ncbi:prenyltransferase alpha subunit repeat-containing protein [Thalictrum thalictroides]|uniref:Prenyltransferase alpha subunit repeat-containing protein n=1 Tax=Thalictrum thalictroides TaxID=46969 RepID=A0A7J6VV72_THATH|nr:prenyltransferase alpha subunit repeat-containing protein [Thalictrum thalictroides]
MTENKDSDDIAFHQLKQLERILECDPLINEVGFIHPSQFAALDDEIVGSDKSVAHSIPQSVDEFISTNLDANDLQHDSSIFWIRDHKLAISTEALFHLYNAAKHAFMAALTQQKMVDSLCRKTDKSLNKKVTDDNTGPDIFLESEVMNHSKALLLLSCDNGTAWNSRKLICSKKQCLSLLMDELLFSALILSYAPKSESAWSHRRWVIKAIDGKYPKFEDVVERESELVEKIAERSKMNYRAWNHRCWLITYMTKEQVINQLQNSRKWAELHVGDSSCFHYRQLLLQRMLKHCSRFDVYHVRKEELEWNEMLIKRYIGREALWVHRRFLSQLGSRPFRSEAEKEPYVVSNQDNINMNNFISSEMQLLHSCLSISDNDFEDIQSQGVFAASYILWMFKFFNLRQQLHNSQLTVLEDMPRVMGELKMALNKLCPEKTLLWEDQVISRIM